MSVGCIAAGRRRVTSSAPTAKTPIAAAVFVHVRDISNGWDLYQKAADTITGNDEAASLAKLMTSIVIMQRKSAVLDSETLMVQSGDLPGFGNTLAGLQAGDVLTWRDLLYGIALPSGNDAALAGARVIGDEMYAAAGNTGTTGVTRFVEEMNIVGAAIGLTKTTFGSPSGVNGAVTTTTARDISRTAEVCFDDPTLETMAASASWLMTITGANARTYTVSHTSALINGPFASAAGIKDANTLAAKSGSKDPSYSHLAKWVAPDGQVLIVTVIKSPTSYGRYLDTRGILYSILKDFPYLWASSPVGTDAQFANVKVLAGGESGFIDESPIGRTLIAAGGVTRSTAKAIVGDYSFDTDGTDGRIEAADTADLTPGSSNFALEFFFRGSGSLPGGSFAGLAGKYSRSNNQREYVIVYDTAGNNFEIFASANGAAFASAVNGFNANGDEPVFFNGAPRHFMLRRAGAEIALYIDGEKQPKTIAFSTTAIFNGAAKFMVGARGNNTTYEDPTQGTFDDIRLTIGHARQTAAMFTVDPRGCPRS